jgi:hypothetical protein
MSTFTTPDTFLTVGRAKREQAKSALKRGVTNSLGMQFRLPRDAVQNGSPQPILLIPFRQNEENRKNAKILEKSWRLICI